MDEAELKRIIETLDRELPKEKAQTAVGEWGGGEDESALHATRNGFLRGGVELLKAAVAEVDKRGFVQSDLGDYIHPDSTFNFDAIRRLETIPPVESTPRWKEALGKAVGCVVILGVLLCLITGFAVIAKTIAGLIF